MDSSTPCSPCFTFKSDDSRIGCSPVGFLCDGFSAADENELLRDYECQIEITRDHPLKLARPLDWRVELACRGGIWPSSPVPKRILGVEIP